VRKYGWATILLAIGGLVAIGLLFFHRPEGQAFYPRCTFHQWTGLLCPGCGGLRASHELLHGRLFAAARCNLLLVLGIPGVLAVMAWGWRRGRSVAITGRTVWILFGVVTVFTVIRNLPGLPARILAP